MVVLLTLALVGNAIAMFVFRDSLRDIDSIVDTVYIAVRRKDNHNPSLTCQRLLFAKPLRQYY